MHRLLARAVFTLLLVLPAGVQAHFVWLVPVHSDSQTAVHVYLGEDATDDNSEYLSRVNGLSMYRIVGNAPATAIELTTTDESVSAVVKGDCQCLYVASHDLGVMDRGDSVFRLKYYAKTGPDISSEAWQKSICTDDLRLDVVPSVKDGKVSIDVCFDEKPVAGVQVKVARPGADDIEALTDKNGIVSFRVADAGMYSIRVRHVEARAGEFQGKKYSETRHYSTVAVNVPTSGSPVAVSGLQNLPQPVTSFGAAVLNDSLYMYGGHTGSAHSYSQKEQSNHLTRLDLKTGEWETIVDGPHLQGLALVTHDGKLYRIGGFTAMNAEGEDHDLWSQTSVASFDPAKKEWTELPSLPERRSSLDAAVLGDSIYVVGGWTMRGEADSQWPNTAWKMDLSVQPLHWQPIATAPFQRRALSVAAHNGKLFAIGGMQSEGGPTTKVAIYDPATDSWGDGPSLFVKPEPKSDDDNDNNPGRRMSAGAMTGFGTSAFATGGRLYVTTVQGNVQRLSKDGSKWEVARSTTPRFFHRLLPQDDDHLIAIGGANMGIGKFGQVDVIDVHAKDTVVPAPGNIASTAPAEQLMLRAHNARAVWNNFPGFSSDVTVVRDGERVSGKLSVSAKLEIELQLANDAMTDWAESSLKSVVSHRRASESRERKVQFADDQKQHPLGRLIKIEGDRMGSEFRIKDDVITEVHRKMKDSRFTISVTEVSRNAEGKTLPRSYSFSTWDAESGNLKSNTVSHREWKRVGRFDLPYKLLWITTDDEGKREVRQILLSSHKLNKVTKTAAR